MSSQCQGLGRGCHLLFDVDYPWRHAPESPLSQLVLIDQSTHVLRWSSSLSLASGSLGSFQQVLSCFSLSLGNLCEVDSSLTYL